MRPLCSVVFASYNRAHLLRRSVECYNRSRFPLDRLEVVVVDDGSTDDTAALCERFDPRINVVYVRLRKNPGEWKDCAANINVGIRAAKGDVISITHPEVMYGRDSIAAMCDFAADDVWSACKPYYLSKRDQERLDTVDWVGEGPLAVRKIAGFYDDDQIAVNHPDYGPRAIESVGHEDAKYPTWESYVVAAMNRGTWKRTGGFVPTTAWGSCDILWVHRRLNLGIRNVTITNESAYCVHQNHDVAVGDFVPTNRDMDACFAQAPALRPEQCGFPAVDELWGG